MFGFDPRTNQFVSKGGGEVFASAARTAAPATIPEFYNPGMPGLRVDIAVTAIIASPSVVFKIQRYVLARGAWVDVLASAAQTGTGNVVMQVTPALEAAANTIAGEEAPGLWRVLPVHADADSITYAVSYEYLVSGGVFATDVA